MLSRMFLYLTVLVERLSPLKQRTGLFAVQYRKYTISLWGKSQAGPLAAYYNTMGVSKLGVPRPRANPLHVTYPKHSLCVALWDFGGERRGADNNMKLMLLTVLCLLPVSIQCDSLTEEGKTPGPTYFLKE